MKIFNEIDKLQITINEMRPLSKDQLKELRRYFNIGLAYASNALEGNTLTESETKAVIEDGITIGGKPLKYHLEATGHAHAYNFIYQLAKQKELKEKDIKTLHKLFYQQIEADKAGKYRKIRVFLSGSEYKLPKPDEVPGLMKRFVEKYKTQAPDKHPVEIAALIHKDFLFIHPFIDGNGRIARLLMNLILIKNALPITIIPPVLRMEYINLLEKAHKNNNEFVCFIAERVKQAQLEYIRLLT